MFIKGLRAQISWLILATLIPGVCFGSSIHEKMQLAVPQLLPELDGHPQLRQMLPPPIVEALTYDHGLGPAFLAPIPREAMGKVDVPSGSDISIVGVREIENHSGSLIDSFEVAAALARAGQRLIVGVSERGNPLTSFTGRSTSFPLADGGWLAVKFAANVGRGWVNAGSLFDGTYLSRIRKNPINIATAAIDLEENTSPKRRSLFQQLLARRIVHLAPTGSGKMTDFPKATLEFKKTNYPISMGSFDNVLTYDPWLIPMSISVSRNLPRILRADDVMRYSAQIMGMSEGIKIKNGLYRAVFSDYDYNILGQETIEMLQWLTTDVDGLEFLGLNSKLGAIMRNMRSASQRGQDVYAHLFPSPFEVFSQFFQGFFSTLDVENLQRWAASMTDQHQGHSHIVNKFLGAHNMDMFHPKAARYDYLTLDNLNLKQHIVRLAQEELQSRLSGNR